MSPNPAVCVPNPEADVAVVCSVTLVPLFRLFSMAVAAGASMVRSVGSINHDPPGPATIRAVLATETEAPEVLIEPPAPPPGADASSVPLTLTSPARIPARSVMVPS